MGLLGLLSYLLSSRPARVAYTVPVRAQTLKKEPDANQLSCGQKVLVETTRVRRIKFCKLPAAVSTTPTVDMVRTPRGTQYKTCEAQAGLDLSRVTRGP